LADTYVDYVTRQGDTFDIIALRLYNDEFKASLLMQENPAYVQTIVFTAGITLRAPVIEPSAVSTLPPWMR